MGKRVVRGKQTLQANKVFTDREEPRKVFWNAYKKYVENNKNGIENDIKIITYYGIGGAGKSTLLKKLQSELKEYRELSTMKNIYYTNYNFTTSVNKREILESLRNKLMKNYNFQFPIFDLALSVYKLKIGEREQQVSEKTLLDSNQYGSFVANILEVIPGVSEGITVLKAIDQLIANAKLKNSQRAIEISELQKDTPEEILKDLQLYFANDLSSNTIHLESPLVVFLDTYECLVNELKTVGEPLMSDYWIRNDHNGLITHVVNTLWVVSGREKLKWGTFDSEWDDTLDQHIIGDLSKTDAISFLKHAGIKNEELLGHIYNVSKGSPLYLDLCVDNYYSRLNNGLSLDINSIGNTSYELIERFLRYMDDHNKDVLYIMACISDWTLESLYTLVKRVLGKISYSRITKLNNVSFITTKDDEVFHMHLVVKEVLLEQCPKWLLDKTIEENHTILRKSLDELQVNEYGYVRNLYNLVSNFFVGQKTNEEVMDFYRSTVKTHIQQLYSCYLYDDAVNIIQKFIPYVKESNNAELQGLIYRWFSRSLRQAGYIKEMITYAKMCYETYKSAYGLESIETLKALNTLAFRYSDAGLRREALKISEQVVSLKKDLLGEEDESTIISLHNLSIAYWDSGKREKAHQVSQKVYDLQKKRYGENDERTIRALYNLAIMENSVGNHKIALEYGKEILEQYQKIYHKHHPSIIDAMNNLGAYYGNLGYYLKAEELLEEAYHVKLELLGEKHPETITSMYNYSIVLSDKGELNLAIPLSKKAVELRIKSLGQEHPDTLMAMHNLWIDYDNLGDETRAKALLSKTLDLRKKILGENHPDTQSSINGIKKEV